METAPADRQPDQVWRFVTQLGDQLSGDFFHGGAASGCESKAIERRLSPSLLDRKLARIGGQHRSRPVELPAPDGVLPQAHLEQDPVAPSPGAGGPPDY